MSWRTMTCSTRPTDLDECTVKQERVLKSVHELAEEADTSAPFEKVASREQRCRLCPNPRDARPRTRSSRYAS